MRANSVSIKDRKVLNLGNFRGIDLSSSPLNISKSRAVEQSNMIMKNGCLQTRDAIWHSNPFAYPNIKKIFHFYGSLAIFTEGFLYLDADLNTGGDSYAMYDEFVTANVIKDQLIYKVKEGATYKTYIIKIINDNYVKFEVGKLDFTTFGVDENLYTPCTTTNISAMDEEYTSEAFEEKNLLSKWRYNLLVGKTDGVYQLDGEMTNLSTVWLYDEDTELYYSTKWGEDGLEIANPSGVVVGEVNFQDSQVTLGATFNGHYVRCYFESGGVTDVLSDVNIIFGENSSIRRLFSVGARGYGKSVVYFSDIDKLDYFPLSNYTSLGSEYYDIKALQILTDNVLVAYKNSVGEPNIYYLSGTQEYKEIDGITTEIVYRFIQSGGMEGEIPVNNNACATLLGDPMFVSKNGIYSLAPSSISQNAKYYKERSSLINNFFKKNDVSDAVMFTCEDKVYVSIPSKNVIFVGDSKYKYSTSNQNPENNFEYEWFKWDISADSLFYDNDTLFFIKGGKVFTYGKPKAYKDYPTIVGDVIETFPITNGSLSIEEEDGHFNLVKSALLDLSGYEYIGFKTEVADFDGETTIEYQIFKIYAIDGTTIYCEGEGNEYEGHSVYDFDGMQVSGTGIAFKTKNLESVYITGILDLNANYLKTLERLSITCEPFVKGNMTFGYQTYQNYKMYERLRNVYNGFDFEEFSFNEFEFDGDFASTKTIKVKERNFNYIQFAFRSINTKLAVNNLLAVYKFNTNNRGIN